MSTVPTCHSTALTSIDSYLGAYLGALLNEMLDPNPSAAETPSSYVFRQACGVLLMSDMKQRYDGETQRDCMEYLEKLLDHLDWEELDGRIENFEAPSLVRELFGVEATTKASRYSRCLQWQR